MTTPDRSGHNPRREGCDFRSFQKDVLPEANARKLGVLGMKPLAFTRALKVAALLARAKELGASGRGEPFKLGTDFDNRPSASPPTYDG